MIDQGHEGSQWLGWKLSSGHWSKVDKQKGKGKGGGTQEVVAFNGEKALGLLGPSSNSMGACLLPKIPVENTDILISLQRDLWTRLGL